MTEEALGRLEEEILTLLTDGEESMATLLASLIELELDRATKVPVALAALDELERLGLITVGVWTSDMPIGTRPRKPSAAELVSERGKYETLADAAAEEWPFIGLWYSLTEQGRKHWIDQNGTPPISMQWQIRHIVEQHLVVIEAASDAVAEVAVSRWRKENPALAIPAEPSAVESPVQFKLRDGTVVQRGVRWFFPLSS
jgi:hypothetical protein